MSEDKSLININIDTSGLSKPGKELVRALSRAFGAVYRPLGTVREAKARSKADIIAAQTKNEISEIEQRGLERLIIQEGRKQANIEEITKLVINELPKDAEPENMDDDWIHYFFDKCSIVSNNEMRTLWAKLLAGEATKPGKFSRLTLDVVSYMSQKDAHLFTNLAQFVFKFPYPTTLIFNYNDPIYTSSGINFDTLTHLDTLGLVKFNTVSSHIKKGIPKRLEIQYFNHNMQIKFDAEAENTLKAGCTILTQTGIELFDICGAIENTDFPAYAREKILSQPNVNRVSIQVLV